MKSLFLTYDGLCDPLGGSQILPYLAGLADLGHSISVVSFEKPRRPSLAFDRVRQACAEHGIRWHPLRYHKRPPVASTVWDLLAMRAAAESLHRREPFDLIHCRSYIPALVGLRLKHRHDLPFLFDMRGFWPEERVEGGSWNLGNPLFRAVFDYFKQKERQLLAEADAVVTLTEAASKEISARQERPVRPPVVIPCCVDFRHFSLPDAEDRRKSRQRLGVKSEARILCYLGSLGGNYLLDEMLRFFVAYRSKSPNSSFLFITPEPASAIKARAGEFGIAPQELIIVQADRQEVPILLAAADHGVAFKRPGFAAKGCSPTKLGEMMALGIPVVANAGVGDVDAVLGGNKAGVLVENFDDTTLTTAADTLLALPAGEAIRAHARIWFDLRNGVKAYDRIYRVLGASEGLD